MRPDNTAPIIAAARRRHELARAKAIQAIRELDRTGRAVTFSGVAGKAGVSRSWLYSQPDIRDQIQRLRHATGRSAAARIPASQRASDASLLRRLEAARRTNSRFHCSEPCTSRSGRVVRDRIELSTFRFRLQALRPSGGVPLHGQARRPGP